MFRIQTKEIAVQRLAGLWLEQVTFASWILCMQGHQPYFLSVLSGLYEIIWIIWNL